MTTPEIKTIKHLVISNFLCDVVYLNRVATVLEIRENEKGLKRSGEVREFEKEREKSGKFDRLFERKSFATPQGQLDDLSFCQMLYK